MYQSFLKKKKIMQFEEFSSNYVHFFDLLPYKLRYIA